MDGRKVKTAEVASKNRIRLVALDIDGTLLRSDKRLTQMTADTVLEVVRRGVHVVLASARPPRSVRPFYDCMGLKTPQINYNGALIYDPVTGKNLHHQPLDPGLVKRVVRFARRRDPAVLVSVEILDRWYTDRPVPVNGKLQTETSRAFKPDFIGPLKAFLHVPATKLMFLGPPRQSRELHEQLAVKFQGQVNIVVSDKHLLQVLHPGVDKAGALGQIAGGFGIDRSAVMAIGDAPNDLEMIRWAGVGVAVGNAWREVLDVADHVVPSNDDYGVVHALRRFVLDG